jgi:hypothetical protein
MQLQITRTLERQATTYGRCLLIVDDGHNLDDSALKVLHTLPQPEVSGAKPFEIVLAGLPEIIEKFTPSDFAQFRQCLRIDQLAPPDVIDYINHRMRMAGANGASIFGQDACAAIAKNSEGIPAKINSLCCKALQTGAEHNLERINVHTVESILDRDHLLSRPELLHAYEMTPKIFRFATLFLIIVIGANFWHLATKHTRRSLGPVTTADVPLPQRAGDANRRAAAEPGNSPPSVVTSTRPGDAKAATTPPTFSPSSDADSRSNVLELPTRLFLVRKRR